jgi:hypothetical protein
MGQKCKKKTAIYRNRVPEIDEKDNILKIAISHF